MFLFSISKTFILLLSFKYLYFCLSNIGFIMSIYKNNNENKYQNIKYIQMEFPIYDGKMDLKLYLYKLNKLKYSFGNNNNIIKFLNILFETNYKFIFSFKFIPISRITSNEKNILNALNLFPELKNEIKKKKILNIIRMILKKNGYTLKTTKINNEIYLFIK